MTEFVAGHYSPSTWLLTKFYSRASPSVRYLDPLSDLSHFSLIWELYGSLFALSHLHSDLRFVGGVITKQFATLQVEPSGVLVSR